MMVPLDLERSVSRAARRAPTIPQALEVTWDRLSDSQELKRRSRPAVKRFRRAKIVDVENELAGEVVSLVEHWGAERLNGICFVWALSRSAAAVSCERNCWSSSLDDCSSC